MKPYSEAVPSKKSTPIISPRLVMIGMTILDGSKPHRNDIRVKAVVMVIIVALVMRQTRRTINSRVARSITAIAEIEREE